jgi:hypothetical protein
MSQLTPAGERLEALNGRRSPPSRDSFELGMMRAGSSWKLSSGTRQQQG